MKTLHPSSMLDIIFESRNKLYGAYELRIHYNRRLLKAIGITFAALSIIVSANMVIGKNTNSKHRSFKPDGHTLIIPPAEQPEVIKTPPPPATPPIEEIKIATSKLARPVVTTDELVTPDDEMKNVDEMLHTKIGTINAEGAKSDIVAPPIEEDRGGSGIFEQPVVEVDSILIVVDIQAAYPGGLAAWTRYISREINRNIGELEADGKAGQCIVQFVVDTDGSISNVEALTFKGTKLAELSINAIRNGPKWIPAEFNGKKVKAYRKQPVSFKLLND